MPEPYFDHEKLHVYQEALRFISWADTLVGLLESKYALKDQLIRASTSIALNIAEGNGRYKAADRCRFFDIARGSALECAAFVDILVTRQLITQKQGADGKTMLKSIVSMIVGLIKNNSDRVHDSDISYG
mgnify:CR=1 FL=1